MQGPVLSGYFFQVVVRQILYSLGDRRSKMKRLFFALVIILFTLPLIIVPASAAKPGPDTTITVLNPPPDGILVLQVGQSYTFDIQITSSQKFVSAMAKVDIFFPGRGVFWHAGTDTASQANTALLHLTVIGKSSTAAMREVCDWPAPGICWPAGVAPQMIVAGARFKGGLVSGDAFPFAVMVP
jgi:hypothetical protein